MGLATFDQLERADGVEYENVEAYGLDLRIGSLTTIALQQWEARKKESDFERDSGLWLIVFSLVDKQGVRLPEGVHGKWVEILRAKADKDNSNVIQAILELNNLNEA